MSTWRRVGASRKCIYSSLFAPAACLASAAASSSSLLARRHSSPYRQWRLRPGRIVSLTRGVLLDCDRKMPKSSTRRLVSLSFTLLRDPLFRLSLIVSLSLFLSCGGIDLWPPSTDISYGRFFRLPRSMIFCPRTKLTLVTAN